MSTGLGRTFAFASERGALDLESHVNAVITRGGRHRHLPLRRTRGGAMDSVTSRAASAPPNADAEVIGAPAHRSHSARARAGAPSENFINEILEAERIRIREATAAAT
jgi:hypothetical protein